MFIADNDYTKFLDNSHTAISINPGYPYFRAHPNFSNHLNFTSEKEDLLIAMHGQADKLLIISNKRILIYKVSSEYEETKSNGINILRDLNIANLTKWIPKRRRLRHHQKQEYRGVFLQSDDIINLTRPLQKSEILALIICLRQDIFLQNSFSWKTLFDTSLTIGSDYPDIYMFSKGVRILSGKKRYEVRYLGKEMESFKILAQFCTQYDQRKINITLA